MTRPDEDARTRAALCEWLEERRDWFVSLGVFWSDTGDTERVWGGVAPLLGVLLERAVEEREQAAREKARPTPGPALVRLPTEDGRGCYIAPSAIRSITPHADGVRSNVWTGEQGITVALSPDEVVQCLRIGYDRTKTDT